MQQPVFWQVGITAGLHNGTFGWRLKHQEPTRL